VDHEADVPPYLQIAAIIRRRIESGELAPGKPVPSVAQIVGEYGVARTTAQKALRALRDEGLVRIVQGWGTFVTERK
jgi:DNA-binding GntR family transcriptional regulator